MEKLIITKNSVLYIVGRFLSFLIIAGLRAKEKFQQKEKGKTREFSALSAVL